MDENGQYTDGSEESGQNRVFKQLKVDKSASQIEPWMPRVVKNLLEVDDMEVSIVHEDNFKKIIDDLKESKYIGLTVISEKKEYPLAVCLTTIGKIYVFHYKEIEMTIKFLKFVLRQKRLTFFTVDGVWTAALLYKWKIKLRDYPNVLDLQCMDMHASFIGHILNSAPPPNKYGITHLVEHLKPLKPELDQLVSIWMREELDLKSAQEEIRPLRELPYSVLAQNAIKKQASLVRKLGVIMKQRYEILMHKPSKAIFSLARRANSEIREEYDRRGSRHWSDLCQTLSRCPAMDGEW